MEDKEGDIKVGIISFPVKYGFSSAKNLILSAVIILIAFTFYPFLTQHYKIEYFVVVMIIVNPVLVYFLKSLFKDDLHKNLNKLSFILKLEMVFGLIAIYLGKFNRL
jgi:geranylgeranylglycerol-phosphate geranylgeranyltransferase